MQEWTDKKAERFTELRVAKMHGELTDSEKIELDVLYKELEALDEAFYAPMLARMEADSAKLQAEIVALEHENAEMVALYNQQSLLINEAKAWLEQFERRYAVIQESYQKLTLTPSIVS